jgi:hypothetical protein
MKPLKPAQERAAILIASGRKCCEVAKEIGVTPETVSHWQRLPAFKAYSNQARLDFLEATRDKLRGYGPQAVEALADVMRFSSSDGARIKAASVILSHLNCNDLEKQAMSIGSTDPDSFTTTGRRKKELDAMLGDLANYYED